jgi:phosphomannomutase
MRFGPHFFQFMPHDRNGDAVRPVGHRKEHDRRSCNAVCRPVFLSRVGACGPRDNTGHNAKAAGRRCLSFKAEAQFALGENSRVVLRYSGTEQLTRVMVEAAHDAEVQRFSQSVANALRSSIGA